MKLTIDTNFKTIEIDEPILLSDFINQISLIIPNWREYTLKSKVITSQTNYPIIIQKEPLPYSPYIIPSIPYTPPPMWNTPIYCGDPPPGTGGSISANTLTSENKQCKCN